jgi:hypothetical protein
MTNKLIENQQIILESNYPERFVVIENTLFGVYKSKYNKQRKLCGGVKSRFYSKLYYLSSTKKTLSKEETEKLYPEYFLD